MKKLVLAVGLLFVTAAFEQKASIVYKTKPKPVTQITSSLDSLVSKIETLNNLRKNEK